MLVLSRCVGQEIVIDERVRIVVTTVRGNRVQLGILAPRSVRVDRSEIHDCTLSLPRSVEADLAGGVPVKEDL